MPAHRPDDFAVLLVCTGNICRSAMGERLGRAYLDEVLGADAGLVRLTSAGTQAVVGSAMHPDSALVLQGYGGDPAGFAARQLEDGMVVDADLVLTMTRGHRRDVLARAPRALARTFTLREAADLAAMLGPDAQLPEGGFAERARDLVRQWAGLRGRRQSSDADDVPDPIGRPLEAHEIAGELIAPALLMVLDRLVVAGRTDRDAVPGRPA
ncbi:arsenate reductase/protein-tyrosine-phosphatase family protein [Blastococcus sp. SYSU D00820]